MNHKLQTVLCGLAVILCACGGSGATNPPPPSQPVATATPNLGGTVVERRGGAPVVGATVRVVGSDLTTVTDRVRSALT